jgi:HpiC1 cyclase
VIPVLSDSSVVLFAVLAALSPAGLTAAWNNQEPKGADGGGTISQTVGATIQTGDVYTLNVDLGWSKATAFLGSAGLLVNGVLYQATRAEPVRGGWSTYTATYTGLAADAGDSITIKLLAGGIQG